jgi:diguanylate cyclase (GGDEF)-like protein/PAS domain S-box-containing protein
MYGRRAWRHDILVGLGFFILASLSALYTRFGHGVALIWPASALLVSRLMTIDTRDWWRTLLCAAAGSAAATSLVGIGPVYAPARVVANMGEALIAALLLRRTGLHRHALDSAGWLLRYIPSVGLVAPAFGGLVSAAMAWGAGRPDFIQIGLTWATGHALGMLLFMPIFGAFLDPGGQQGATASLRSGSRRFDLGRTLAAASAIALVATLVFTQSTLPLLFLPILMLAVSAVWSRPATLMVMYVVLAVIAMVFTARGSGPIALMPASFTAHMFFLQFYLASTVLCLTPISGAVERQRRIQRQLAESEAAYRLLAENTGDVIMSTRADGTISFVSPSVQAITGRSPETLIGTYAGALVLPEHIERIRAANQVAMASPGKVMTVQFLGLSQDGPMRWFESRLQAVPNADGPTELPAELVVSVIRDISHIKAAEQALKLEAITDPLTGLANRRQFEQALRICADSGAGGCVALFDLDHFKRVNDSFGHAAGDEVLRTFARIGRTMLRASDTLARFGGEEFALVLPGASIATAEMVCGRLAAEISRSVIEVGKARILVTTSIGIATLGPDTELALRKADRALYEAKGAGRDRMAVAA